MWPDDWFCFFSFWQLFGRSMYLINDMIYLRKRSSPSSFSCAIWSRVCPNVLAKLIPTLCIVLPKFVDTHRTSFWCSHFHFISRVDANNASSGFATSCRVFQRFLKAVSVAQFTVWNGFGVFRASRHKSNFPFHTAVFNDEDWWKHPKDREELHDVGFSESFSRFDSSTKLSGSGQSVKVDQRGCPSAFSNLLLWRSSCEEEKDLFVPREVDLTQSQMTKTIGGSGYTEVWNFRLLVCFHIGVLCSPHFK